MLYDNLTGFATLRDIKLSLPKMKRYFQQIVIEDYETSIFQFTKYIGYLLNNLIINMYVFI